MNWEQRNYFWDYISYWKIKLIINHKENYILKIQNLKKKRKNQILILKILIFEFTNIFKL